MSTYAVSPLGMEAIERAVQRAMDGTGRVDAEQLAVVLAEHEPERHRQESSYREIGRDGEGHL